MNILVLLKQVPQSEAATEINPQGSFISRSPNTPYKMNRFDEYALEEALIIKESYPGVRVDVVTLGPERAKEVLKRAFGMGADEGIHILADDGAYHDPGDVAAQLAGVAGNGDYDLIFSGIMSEDMMQAQTGQMVAEIMGLPCVSSVIGFTLDVEGKKAHVKREIEGGRRNLLQITLPCLFTIQAGINTPRYPTLSKILKANSKSIQMVKEKTTAQRQQCLEIRSPEKQRAGLVLQGSRDDKARELARILRQKNIMR